MKDSGADMSINLFDQSLSYPRNLCSLAFFQIIINALINHLKYNFLCIYWGKRIGILLLFLINIAKLLNYMYQLIQYLSITCDYPFDIRYYQFIFNLCQFNRAQYNLRCF